MKCEKCFVEYLQKRPWQRFCSKKCKDLAFFERNPNARSLYNKKQSKTPKFKYHVQKNVAKRRGIPFELTYEEWWSIWEPLS